MEFFYKVRFFEDTRTGPLLVHCSAGVGRTGTFVAFDILTKQAKAEEEVDVAACVVGMRHNRTQMVQTFDQYK